MNQTAVSTINSRIDPGVEATGGTDFRRKRFLLFSWLSLIAVFMFMYIWLPQLLSPHNLKKLFAGHLAVSLTLYFILGTLRGFTLLPSTPMVIAGSLVLPLWPLFLVNLLCVLTSSAIVYYLGCYFEFDRFFKTHYPVEMTRLKQALEVRIIPVAIIWSFFPLVPTDLICCVGGMMRINAARCLLGVMIGEGILCALYIWGGNLFLTGL